MKTTFKDVAHLYLGCEVEVKRKNDKIPIVGRMCEITKNSNHGDWVEVRFEHVETVTNRIWETSASNFHTFFFNDDDVKPLLRKLGSMTDEDARKGSWRDAKTALSFFEFHKYIDTRRFFACDIILLASMGYDLFNLIDSGEAIDLSVK